jgi:excisionase family DNA binding protein
MTGEAEWLDAEAAASYLDLHPNTIYRMIRDGRLPAMRFPVRIRREDLDDCLERCRIKPGELAHLNQYARGEHLSAERLMTKAGNPDRRFGPRRGVDRSPPGVEAGWVASDDRRPVGGSNGQGLLERRSGIR